MEGEGLYVVVSSFSIINCGVVLTNPVFSIPSSQKSVTRFQAALKTRATYIYPSSVIRHPVSIIRHPSSVIRYPLSVIRHPPSAIRHPVSIIRHPVSIIRHPSSVICYPSSFFSSFSSGSGTIVYSFILYVLSLSFIVL